MFANIAAGTIFQSLDPHFQSIRVQLVQKISPTYVQFSKFLGDAITFRLISNNKSTLGWGRRIPVQPRPLPGATSMISRFHSSSWFNFFQSDFWQFDFDFGILVWCKRARIIFEILKSTCKEKKQKFSLVQKMATRCRFMSKIKTCTIR